MPLLEFNHFKKKIYLRDLEKMKGENMDLRKIPILNNLTDRELEDIKSLGDLSLVTYPKDSHIFKMGEIKEDLYYLISGRVKVYKIDPEGKRYIIASFDKPAIFGEVYAYLKEPFDFWAQADVDSEVFVIKNFRNLINKSDSTNLRINFIEILARKSLKLSKKNQINSQSNLKQKIAAYLLDREKDSCINLSISREEWADYLATTRPSLSRSLSIMDREGLIKVEDKKITIIDKKTLKELI